MTSIPLHPQYGVNPAIPVCFYCGEEKNEILLLGNNYKEEAPRRAVWNQEPCDQCRDYMKQGIILLGVDETKSKNMNNPYRTGQFVVVSDNWVRRVISPPELVKDILKRRMAYVPEQLAQQLIDFQHQEG